MQIHNYRCTQIHKKQMYAKTNLLMFDCCVLLRCWLWRWFVLLLLALQLVLLVLPKVQGLDHDGKDNDDHNGDDDNCCDNCDDGEERGDAQNGMFFGGS